MDLELGRSAIRGSDCREDLRSSPTTALWKLPFTPLSLSSLSYLDESVTIDNGGIMRTNNYHAAIAVWQDLPIEVEIVFA